MRLLDFLIIAAVCAVALLAHWHASPLEVVGVMAACVGIGRALRGERP